MGAQHPRGSPGLCNPGYPPAPLRRCRHRPPLAPPTWPVPAIPPHFHTPALVSHSKRNTPGYIRSWPEMTALPSAHTFQPAWPTARLGPCRQAQSRPASRRISGSSAASGRASCRPGSAPRKRAPPAASPSPRPGFLCARSPAPSRRTPRTGARTSPPHPVPRRRQNPRHPRRHLHPGAGQQGSRIRPPHPRPHPRSPPPGSPRETNVQRGRAARPAAP